MAATGPGGDEVVRGDGASPPNLCPHLSSTAATREEKIIRKRNRKIERSRRRNSPVAAGVGADARNPR